MNYSEIKTAADAYWWFYHHDGLQSKHNTPPWMDLTPNMVNPEDCAINEDHSLNTKLEWWIEAGMYCDDEHGGITASHDYRLDCGGDTAEEAVFALAALVFEHYGDYDYDY